MGATFEVRGSLGTDAGMRVLDKVYAIASSDGEDGHAAIEELMSFFVRHLSTGFLPYSAAKEYPSEVQRSVYSWIDSKYRTFVKLIVSKFEAHQLDFSQTIAKIAESDPSDETLGQIATIFTNVGLNETSVQLLKDHHLQSCLYSLLAHNFPASRSLAIKVISSELPNPTPLPTFSDLYIAVVSSPLSDQESLTILKNFGCILQRVDDRLITFEFLHMQLQRSPVHASFAIPYLVEVSITRAVDVKNFYEITFSSITFDTLTSSGRKRFFDTLSRVLSPKALQSYIPTAFAVKLSRFLPIVPLPAQIDIISLIQYLCRAHNSVLNLMTPSKGEISNVSGKLQECLPQTLWEVIAFQSASLPSIGEATRTMGQRWMPPDFESFDLKKSVESCKIAQKRSDAKADWCKGLDPQLWSK